MWILLQTFSFTDMWKISVAKLWYIADLKWFLLQTLSFCRLVENFYCRLETCGTTFWTWDFHRDSFVLWWFLTLDMQRIISILVWTECWSNIPSTSIFNLLLWTWRSNKSHHYSSDLEAWTCVDLKTWLEQIVEVSCAPINNTFWRHLCWSKNICHWWSKLLNSFF